MFIFNLKLNKNLFSKILFILMLIIIISIFIYGVYVIFIKHNKTSNIDSCIKNEEIFEITESNYTNILKASNDNVDNYVGLKVHVIGYVYRLLNFEENQFVIARDMLISNDNQYLIVGFLAESEDVKNFEDGTWVDVIGEIKKGDYAGDIALLDVISITKTNEPQNSYVSMPDETYIPTFNPQI